MSFHAAIASASAFACTSAAPPPRWFSCAAPCALIPTRVCVGRQRCLRPGFAFSSNGSAALNLSKKHFAWRVERGGAAGKPDSVARQPHGSGVGRKPALVSCAWPRTCAQLGGLDARLALGPPLPPPAGGRCARRHAAQAAPVKCCAPVRSWAGGYSRALF